MTLKEQLMSQLQTAKITSEFSNQLVIVAMMREAGLPTRIVVGGGAVSYAVWELAYGRGARIRALAVFRHGARLA